MKKQAEFSTAADVEMLKSEMADLNTKELLTYARKDLGMKFKEQPSREKLEEAILAHVTALVEQASNQPEPTTEPVQEQEAEAEVKTKAPAIKRTTSVSKLGFTKAGEVKPISKLNVGDFCKTKGGAHIYEVIAKDLTPTGEDATPKMVIRKVTYDQHGAQNYELVRPGSDSIKCDLYVEVQPLERVTVEEK
jgi:hypothetical protein